MFLPCTAYSAPGDTLFNDNFERNGLFPWTTTNSGVSGILAGGAVSNSPTRGAFTRSQAVTVTSPGFFAAVPAAEIRIWVRHGSDTFSEYPDAGENLVIEYRRANNTWAQLLIYAGGGTAGQVFNSTMSLPPDALHGNLAIRARQTGGSGGNFDYWHFDDVVVTERAPPPPLGVGTCDDFEAGLSGNWTINPTSGFAGVNSNTSQSPTNSMFLNGGVVTVSSASIDSSDPTFGNLTVWIRRGSDAFSEDTDSGENLVVEYRNVTNNWIALETFNGNGSNGQIYLRSYNLPADGRHAGMSLRFRMTGGSGATYDFWHIDDVCIEQALVPVLHVAKNVVTVSDTVNGISNPKAIPGAIVRYTIEVTNQGPGAADAGSLDVSDVIPQNAALFVDTSGGDPVRFTDGSVSSGLLYNYATDVAYSNQSGGGPPYDYTPVPDVSGFDAAITGMQINPAGIMNAASGGNSPSFTIEFEIRIE